MPPAEKTSTPNLSGPLPGAVPMVTISGHSQMLSRVTPSELRKTLRANFTLRGRIAQANE